MRAPVSSALQLLVLGLVYSRAGSFVTFVLLEFFIQTLIMVWLFYQYWSYAWYVATLPLPPTLLYCVLFAQGAPEHRHAGQGAGRVDLPRRRHCRLLRGHRGGGGGGVRGLQGAGGAVQCSAAV